MSTEKDTGHNYDGIRELDNAIPNWFRALFYLTVLFGVGYWFYYSLGNGPTLVQELERERMQDDYARYAREAKGAQAAEPTETDLQAVVHDSSKKTQGGSVYQAKCVSCHGKAGEGGIGPNLTDAYWIHGGTLADLARTINQGVPDKGMPPWKALLQPDELLALVAYVRGLEGTQPPNAKAPQGTLVQRK